MVPFDIFKKFYTSHTSLLARLGKTVIIVLMAFVLSMLLMQPFSISTATLIDSDTPNDYSITDFYNKVADSRAVRTLDPDIVIVDIDTLNREQIAELIDAINLAGPKVLAIDITFTHPHADDSYLIGAINDSENAVLAMNVTQAPGNDKRFVVAEHSFFADSCRGVEGVANLPSLFAKGTIREFPMSFVLARGDTVPSFAAAVAMAYRPELNDEIAKREGLTEVINFPSRTFRTLKPSEVMEHPEWIEGRIVMLGAIADDNDMHKTPIAAEMSGVQLHSYAVATIINQAWMNKLTDAQNWLIAIALCAMFVFLSVTIAVGYKGLVLRIVQVLALYLIVRLGYYFFISHNIVIDFSCTFLMITFGLFASDIYIGAVNLSKLAYQKLKNSKIMKKLALRRGAMAIALALASCLSLSARYTLYSVKGDVTATRGGSPLKLAPNIEVKGTDVFHIPADGKVAIVNDVSNSMYESQRTGIINVQTIIAEARQQNGKIGDQIDEKLRLGRSKSEPAGYVFVESGSVTRSLVYYESENEDLTADDHSLGLRVAHMVNNLQQGNLSDEDFPLGFNFDKTTPEGANGFDLTNTLDFPVYFNVIKLIDGDASCAIVSELGQPTGCYELAPNQSFKRSQRTGLDVNDRHLLIITPYEFDITSVLLDVGRYIASGNLPELPNDTERVYMKRF